jgi:hypothetical protein
MFREQNVQTGIDACPVPSGDWGNVNLKILARQYETEGFPVPANRDALRERYQANPEQRDIDLYALGVPIVHSVIAAADSKRAGRPPYGLVNPAGLPQIHFPTTDPFGTLRETMKYTLTQESAAYFAPENLAERFRENPHAQRNHDVFDLSTLHGGEAEVNDGIFTAVKIFSAFFKLVPDLHDKQFDWLPESHDAIQIASDNYLFLTSLAMTHAKTFGRLTEKVGGGRDNRPIDLASCEYVPHEGYKSGLKLQFTQQTREEFENAYNGWLNDPVQGQRGRIGCIAMYSEALPTLWNWELDIAGEIYKQKLKKIDVAPLTLTRSPRVVYPT